MVGRRRISFTAAIAELDEPFDSRAPFYHKKTFAPQKTDLNEAIFGTLQSGLRKGYGKVCYLESTGKCQLMIPMEGWAEVEELMLTIADGKLEREEATARFKDFLTRIGAKGA